MNYYVDPDIKKTERVFPEQGRYDLMRYDMNENPEGLPKEFVASVLSEITPEYLSVYPEPDRFLRKYANFVGVPFECVTATNGSDQAIRYLLQTFCAKGHEVVTVSPSFEMYWVNCSILGLKHVPVAYEKDLSIDTKKIIQAINPNTDIVVLLNPNNPVGNAFTRQEVQEIVAAAKENGAVVIIDEAYHYFYPETFLDLTQTEEHVVVLRTFSKLFSIPACRLGVIVSNPDIIHYVQNGKLTFDVNAIALLFAERILDNPAMIQQLIDNEHEGRCWLIAQLRSLGYDVRSSEGNFVFVRPKHDAVDVAERLYAKKVAVKYWKTGLLKDYLRISTGSKTAMEKFVEAFLEADAS